MVWGIVARGVLGRIFGGAAAPAAGRGLLPTFAANAGTAAGVVGAGAMALDHVANRALDAITTNPLQAAGIAGAVAIGTAVLNNVIGTPLALVASLGTALYFREQIGELAQTAMQHLSAATAAPAPAPSM